MPYSLAILGVEVGHAPWRPMAARDVSGHMTTTNFWMGTLAWRGQEHSRSANPSCPSPVRTWIQYK
ncbi:hypothetical protein AG1IA_10252 [Rhizoctonia solani AG-1 IA]|uniref:Uncharacterized protein n=1 Tax=Thanatephorus cucumeris (strain AG1-IA) TaxID=983506 RepID=L8WG11_THACA|nr:hypothetical protein AG1IA_10252 [Rhizoctonia solani AG-1 IA]